MTEDTPSEHIWNCCYGLQWLTSFLTQKTATTRRIIFCQYTHKRTAGGRRLPVSFKTTSLTLSKHTSCHLYNMEVSQQTMPLFLLNPQLFFVQYKLSAPHSKCPPPPHTCMSILPEYNDIKTLLIACLRPDHWFSFQKQHAFILKGHYILSKYAQEVGCQLKERKWNHCTSLKAPRVLSRTAAPSKQRDVQMGPKHHWSKCQKLWDVAKPSPSPLPQRAQWLTRLVLLASSGPQTPSHQQFSCIVLSNPNFSSQIYSPTVASGLLQSQKGKGALVNAT